MVNELKPTMNKPARVNRKAAIAIDHILTNQFITVNYKIAIFKTDRYIRPFSSMYYNIFDRETC